MVALGGQIYICVFRKERRRKKGVLALLPGVCGSVAVQVAVVAPLQSAVTQPAAGNRDGGRQRGLCCSCHQPIG